MKRELREWPERFCHRGAEAQRVPGGGLGREWPGRFVHRGEKMEPTHPALRDGYESWSASALVGSQGGWVRNGSVIVVNGPKPPLNSTQINQSSTIFNGVQRFWAKKIKKLCEAARAIMKHEFHQATRIGASSSLPILVQTFYASAVCFHPF